MKVDDTFADVHIETLTWEDAPLRLKWAYIRLVMLATISRFVCRRLGLAQMVEYKLEDGSLWNRKP